VREKQYSYYSYVLQKTKECGRKAIFVLFLCFAKKKQKNVGEKQYSYDSYVLQKTKECERKQYSYYSYVLQQNKRM
jgi:hypothetical protein